MANVLLGVTGSVAAIKTPDLVDAFGTAGHDVTVVATEASLYFFDPTGLPARVVRDADEWPGGRYQRADTVLHIELRRWADVFVLAPLDANTLAKVALGLADNCLTCVWRAWDRDRPRVLAPAMNTLMWTAPATVRHLRLLAQDEGHTVTVGDAEATLAWINARCPRLRVVAPVEKRLACDDVGVGALAEVGQVAAVVEEMLPR